MRSEAIKQAAVAEQKIAAALDEEASRHTRSFAAGIRAQAQIDLSALLRDDDLAELISLRSEEANRLITNLAQDVHDRIERETLGAIFEGRSNEQIAKSLHEIDGIGRTRARLIARDQASKLNAAMNEFRQRQAGVTHYKWKTILDGRERPTHHANNDKVFPWDKPPPVTGHPGHDINCRCRALAVITDEPEEIEKSATPPTMAPGDPIPDFFAANLPAIRSVASVPSTNVGALPSVALSEKLATSLDLQGKIASAGSAIDEKIAEALVVELYGFLPSDADLEAIAGGLLTRLFATRRSILVTAAKERLELITRTLKQAQIKPKT